jgi:transketolase
MWVLYDQVINCNKHNYKNEDRDFFILSKGQATLALYVILAEKGILEKEELKSFCKYDSRFGMQADRTKFDGGIEISAGSLGHGFPIAVGVALANKIKRSTSRVFTLVGDGEFNEGTMWEAALLAGFQKLDNLCVIIDDNKSIGSMINMGDMEQKLTAFGFDTLQIDGHNHMDLGVALSKVHFGKPLGVIAHTIRGYGSETMMSDNKWFHRAPNSEELSRLLEEVDCFEEANV